MLQVFEVADARMMPTTYALPSSLSLYSSSAVGIARRGHVEEKGGLSFVACACLYIYREGGEERRSIVEMDEKGRGGKGAKRARTRERIL